ncbi:glycosyltransferase family 39 protein [[Eubacterium] cellulosolvens]
MNKLEKNKFTKIRAIDRKWLLLGLILFLGFILRILWLLRTDYLGLSLAPDAQEYLVIGENILRGTYQRPREPLFPFFLALLTLLFGSNEFTTRLFTLILSIVVIYLSYILVRKYFKSSWESLLPPFLVATNYYLISHSIMGLREELYSILILLLLFSVLIYADYSLSLGKYASIGILSGALCLTRLEGLAIIISLILFLIWYGTLDKRKPNSRLIITMVVSSTLAIISWAIISVFLFNKLFPTSEVAGSWLYKYEFGQTMQVSLLEYIFRYHTTRELLRLVYIGLMNAISMISNYLTPFGLSHLPFGLILVILGMMFSLKQEKLYALHFVLMGGLIPYLILFALSADFRFIYPFLPIIFLFMSYSVVYLKKNTSDKVHNIRIFLDKKIGISTYNLAMLPIMLVILINLMKFIGNFSVFHMWWESTIAIDLLFLTLIVLYLYHKWRY